MAGTLAVTGNATFSGDIIKSTSGTSNFAAGVNAGNSIQSGGNYNVVVGDEAGTALTTGDGVVAIGFEALATEDANGTTTAIGYQALKVQNTGVESNNTAVGYKAGTAVTTGVNNTIIGGLAGDALTDADDNVAVGLFALTTDTQGSRSTAIGSSALHTQNFSSATNSYNTAVGFQAGYSVTTGTQNTLIGGLAGDSLTDADFNVAIGYAALDADTLGSRSVAIGYNALGTQNFTSATGCQNTAVGYGSGMDLTTGTNNTFIGADAGANVTTGSKNTYVGHYHGNQHSLDLRTSSNIIAISDGDGYPNIFCTSGGHVRLNNQYPSGVDTGSNYHQMVNTTNSSLVADFKHMGGSSAFGIQVSFSDITHDDNTNYFFSCRDSTTTRIRIFSDGDIDNHDNSYSGFSDLKLKEQIVDASSQWDDIKALTIRKFKFKTDVATGDSNEHWRLGVIAQEVETAGMNGLVKNNPDLIENEDGEIVKGDTITKSVKYSILYMKAVKALQEAMTRIETLEAKVATLEG
jgi:hypothetical protein